jgi:hypothetical protein
MSQLVALGLSANERRHIEAFLVSLNADDPAK